MDMGFVAQSLSVALEHQHSADPKTQLLFELFDGSIYGPKQHPNGFSGGFTPSVSDFLREGKHQMEVSGRDEPLFNRLEPGPLVLRGTDRTTPPVARIVDYSRSIAVITMEDLAPFGHGPALSVVGYIMTFLIIDDDRCISGVSEKTDHFTFVHEVV